MQTNVAYKMGLANGGQFERRILTQEELRARSMGAAPAAPQSEEGAA